MQSLQGGRLSYATMSFIFRSAMTIMESLAELTGGTLIFCKYLLNERSLMKYIFLLNVKRNMRSVTVTVTVKIEIFNVCKNIHFSECPSTY